MQILRSQAQPEMTHVLLNDHDVRQLVDALRKPKNQTAKALRAALRKQMAK